MFLGASGCTSNAPADSGSETGSDAAAADATASDALTEAGSADACTAVAEDDGALRYIVCPAEGGCAMITYPDGGSTIGFC